MTPQQMRYFINHLAATSHEQGRTKNYGVGAKVAAGSRNPHGLEYRSWLSSIPAPLRSVLLGPVAGEWRSQLHTCATWTVARLSHDGLT
jgi:hypothetical protein